MSTTQTPSSEATANEKLEITALVDHSGSPAAGSALATERDDHGVVELVTLHLTVGGLFPASVAASGIAWDCCVDGEWWAT